MTSDDGVPTPDLTAFLAAFQRVSAAAARLEQQNETEDGLSVSDLLREHLGVDPRTLAVVTEAVSSFREVDADVALEAVIAGHGGGRLVGVGGGEQRMHTSFSEIVEHSGRFRQFPVGAVDYARAATGPDSERRTVAFGLHLFAVDGVPVALLQRTGSPRHGMQSALEVLCASETTTLALLAELRAAMVTHSVFRGQVVSFTGNPYEPSASGITFLRRTPVPAEDVILPPGTLVRIERQVLGVAQHKEALRAAGQHLKRGVLLYGPPGTGKTHTVRHLVGASEGTTVVVLAGATLRLVGLAAETARAMQPAIVVLEDCDLIAEDRSFRDGPQPLLFEVLDAMDGLAPDADVAFVLTTNRADLLERALAQRPGRVDLAVEVPLPDAEALRRLFELYRGPLPLSPEALDDAAARTLGVTASFVKEVIRRAVLLASEDGREVTDDDLAGAVTEMTADAESITRSLLGVSSEGRDDGGAARRDGQGPRGGRPAAFASTFTFVPRG
ncbi:AAA family ATPase [Xylanimonas protaetiae]|uniref:26S protease regulatory subunit n=1 Tax=Xylanimonas protaetiae TaxID=2509457 RepID=A0A4P6F601_9MICO|nr:ATP-binding protein [Xylanimonas protaetiae]QAY70836.1 26S protease regulatory subunit [Xylanimonas protaetiae]